MGGNAKIPDIELASEETRLSEQRQAKSDFDDIGKDQANHAMDTLQNILLCTTASEAYDEVFNAGLEYRHQYTLTTLLEFINTDKHNPEFEGDPTLREINAIKILTNIYPKLLEYRPDSALTIAKGMCTKLQIEETLATHYDPFDKSKKSERKAAIASTILQFFETTSACVNTQSDETTINIFRTLFQNIDKTDFMSFSRVEDILGRYFKITAENGNYRLFKHMTSHLFSMVDSLNPSLNEDERRFNSATQLYKYIFKLSVELPYSMQPEIRKQIFDRSLAVTSNSLNSQRNRHHYLWVLWNIISHENAWSRDDKLRRQEIAFHIKTLNITQALLQEIVPEEDHNKNELLSTTYSVLRELLLQYANGASGRDDNWADISKKYHSEFKKGLDLYLTGLTVKDISIREDILKSLGKILNIAEIGDTTHPFHREGIFFYNKYFTNQAKALEKQSKDLLMMAEK